MLRSIWHRLFYNPHTVAKKSPFIRIGESKLGRNFVVEFRTLRNAVSFEAGDDCILNCRAVFESKAGFIRIGSGVFINAGTSLVSRSRIDIEDHVVIAWGCMIYDHDSHSLDFRERERDLQELTGLWKTNGLTAMNDWSKVRDWSKVPTAPIKICRNAWLGFDVVVLKGVTIGEGAVIGARSVVTRDIPPWTVAVGNPARVIRDLSPVAPSSQASTVS